MTFEEWFRSEQHSDKYPSYHLVYIEAHEAWKAAHEECAEICESKFKNYDDTLENCFDTPEECAEAIRARNNI